MGAIIEAILEIVFTVPNPKNSPFLDMIVDVMDLHWFSLFFWPEVHPKVISAIYKLFCALLVVNKRFKKSFQEPSDPNIVVSIEDSANSETPTFSTRGFTMLHECLPYCWPNWELYSLLFGLLLGEIP